MVSPGAALGVDELVVLLAVISHLLVGVSVLTTSM